MLDWLIIGGGIHGTHMALVLSTAGVPASKVRIMDPHDDLLARWRHCTANTGMRHLRSPAVHNIDLNPWSLKHFARSNPPEKGAAFYQPYDRPNLSLFDAHCEHVIYAHQLQDLHLCASARGLKIFDDHVRVESESGTLQARKVILSIGMGDQPHWPNVHGIQEARRNDKAFHLFDETFQIRQLRRDDVTVIGGGISAAQSILLMLEQGVQHVHWVVRHKPRLELFDSDPCWLGPACMSAWQNITAPEERRQTIASARHRGSIPPKLFRAIEKEIRKGKVELMASSQLESIVVDSKLDALFVTNARRTSWLSNTVLLATGFEGFRPGRFLEEAIQAYDLPCSACGYPLVDAGLRWHQRIVVTGALAELEMGPTSRNIAGARRAGERLRASL